jgi:hypothetical protein
MDLGDQEPAGRARAVSSTTFSVHLAGPHEPAPLLTGTFPYDGYDRHKRFNAYRVSGGLVLGALYSAIRADEAWTKVWKVLALALSALALAALAYYYSVTA